MNRPLARARGVGRRAWAATSALALLGAAAVVTATPAAAGDVTFYVSPTTLSLGDGFLTQAITLCPTPAGVTDWRVDVGLWQGGVPLTRKTLTNAGSGVPGQWSTGMTVPDTAAAGPAQVTAVCYSASGAAPSLVYDPVTVTINPTPWFTTDRGSASVGTPIHASSVTPCPAPSGAPEWIGALGIWQGGTELRYANFTPAADGSWNATIVVPPTATPGDAHLSVSCGNATGDGLDYQWPPLTYEGHTVTVLPPPVFKPTTTKMAFGYVVVHHTSAASSMTVSNSSGGTLTFGAVHISGTNADDFHVVSDGCGGRTLDPDGVCTERVTFAPLAAGVRSATLVFTDNAPSSPQSIPLSGRGCHVLAFRGLCL